MAINIYANVPIAVTALQTIPFSSIGLDSTNILVIHRIGNPPASWMPTRGINPITGLVKDDGYVIYAKMELDLSNFVVPPIPDSVQEIKNWVMANYAELLHTHTISDIINLQASLEALQPILVSGTNIKSINGQSLLGSGNLSFTSYTDAQARAAISLTTTGSGAASYNSSTGVLNIPTSSYTFTNGLSETTGNAELGGTLTKNTTLSLAGHDFLVENLSFNSNQTRFRHRSATKNTDVYWGDSGFQVYANDYPNYDTQSTLLITAGDTLNSPTIYLKAAGTPGYHQLYISANKLEFSSSGNNGSTNVYFTKLPSATTANVLYYDSATGRVTYGTVPSGGGSGFVDLTTTQTVGGAKTFTSSITSKSGTGFITTAVINGFDVPTGTLGSMTDAQLNYGGVVSLKDLYSTAVVNLGAKNISATRWQYLPNADNITLATAVKVNGTTYNSDGNGLIDLGTISGTGYVDLTTAQTIGGVKTFTDVIKSTSSSGFELYDAGVRMGGLGVAGGSGVNAGAYLSLKSINTSGEINLAAQNTSANIWVYLPNSNGNLATSVKVNGTTYNSNGNGLIDLGTISGGSGVSAGTQYQLAYYAANGSVVSGLTAITGNRVLVSDVNGLPTASSVSNTTLGYLDATSSIQTQLNSKQAALSGTGFIKISGSTISYDNSTYLTTVTGTALDNVFSGTGLLKRTGVGTYTVDTSTYLIGNQSITLSGDASGSGTTSISVTVSKLNNVSLPTMTASAGMLKYTGTGTNTWVFDTSTYQSQLNGTGFVKASGTTISYDNNSYVVSNAAITGNTFTKITYDSKGLVTGGAAATTTDINEGTNQYFTSARVLATALTGLSTATSTAVTATDSVLVAIGKLQAQNTAQDTSISGKQAALSGTGLVKSTSGTISYITDNSTNWNTAYGWGNHATAGYLTSLVHTHGVANSTGTQQFTFGVNENIRFEGTGGTSITYDSATKKIIINSTTSSNLSGGLTNKLAKWTSASTLGNSSISDDGTGMQLTGALTLSTAPTLSTGTFQVLTRNSTTGVIEAIDVDSSAVLYDNEMAQDAIGSILTNSSSISFTYSDATPSITASVIGYNKTNWDNAYSFTSIFPSQTGNSGKYLTTNGSVLSWATVTGGSGSQTLDQTLALGNTATYDIDITDNTKGLILKSANGTRYRVTVNDDGSLQTTEVVTTPPPSGPSGTALTFADLAGWTLSGNTYTGTSTAAGPANQSIATSTSGGVMMQFTGTEENGYLVMNTIDFFATQYDGPYWYITILKSGSTYFVQGGYGNDFNTGNGPNATNTLASGDWVRLWRDGSTGKPFIQKYNSGTTSWDTLYDIVDLAQSTIGATVPTSTAQQFIHMGTYSSNAKVTNPKTSN